MEGEVTGEMVEYTGTPAMDERRLCVGIGSGRDRRSLLLISGGDASSGGEA